MNSKLRELITSSFVCLNGIGCIKKSVTEGKCRRKPVHLQLCPFISRNSPSKKMSLLPFLILWQLSFGECDKPLVSHFQFIFPNSTDPENLTAYHKQHGHSD